MTQARTSKAASGRTNRARMKNPPRAWQRMLSGRRLDLLDPSPLDIEIEDIAHGLARVARWNGQTEGPHAFSVAQHSVVVEELASMDGKLDYAARLAALLHDAPEYVIGDMISPFKAALGIDYKDFEARLERAVHLRFGLPADPGDAIHRAIKRADRLCAYFEATQIAGFTKEEATKFFGAPPCDLHVPIEPLPAGEAQALFLERFHALLAAYEGRSA